MYMTRTLDVGSDVGGRPTYAVGVPTSTSSQVAVLADNSTATLDIPQNVSVAVFSASGSFYFAEGGSLTLPSATVVDSAPILNPGAITLASGATEITVGAKVACDVGVRFY